MFEERLRLGDEHRATDLTKPVRLGVSEFKIAIALLLRSLTSKEPGNARGQIDQSQSQRRTKKERKAFRFQLGSD